MVRDSKQWNGNAEPGSDIVLAIRVVMVQKTLIVMAVVLGEGENVYCGAEVMKKITFTVVGW